MKTTDYRANLHIFAYEHSTHIYFDQHHLDSLQDIKPHDCVRHALFIPVRLALFQIIYLKICAWKYDN